MLPERKKEVQTGLNLIRKALKGDYGCTGSIPKTLAGTVATIKNAERWSKVSATSFGGSQIIIDKLQQKRKECKIGGFPERVCLAYEIWRIAILANADPSYRLAKQYLPQHKAINDTYMGWGGICHSDLTAYARMGMDLPASTFPGAPLYKANGDKWMWDDVMTYAYGRDSKYFKTYKEAGVSVLAELVKLNSEGIVSGLSTKEYNWSDRHNQAWGLWSCQIADQTDYELATQRLNESSGVLDDYINDIFRADATRTDGTLGSGFLYTFGDSTNINPNDFPASVISKTGFQNQWLDATNYFSNISRSNVKGMARNGILYDNGGTQPEYTLEELVKIFKTGSQPSINEPVTAIISSIVVLIGVIVSAVVSIVDISKDAEKEAGLIDPSKSDMSNFNPLGNGSLTSQNDWIPGGGGSGSEKNMMLLAGAGLLGAAAFMGNNKSKKKKKKKKK